MYRFEPKPSDLWLKLFFSFQCLMGFVIAYGFIMQGSELIWLALLLFMLTTLVIFLSVSKRSIKLPKQFIITDSFTIIIEQESYEFKNPCFYWRSYFLLSFVRSNLPLQSHKYRFLLLAPDSLTTMEQARLRRVLKRL